MPLFQRIFKYLKDLLDVSVTSPTDGQVLKYQASSSKWVNGSATATTPTLDAVTSAGAITNNIIDVGQVWVTDSNITIVPDNQGGQIGTAFQLSNRNTDGPTNIIKIHQDAIDSATATVDASGVSNLILGGALSSQSNLQLVAGNGYEVVTIVNTAISNTLDDGSGNMVVSGDLTVARNIYPSGDTLFLGGIVSTANNTLDDGTGIAQINGVLYLESSLIVEGGGGTFSVNADNSCYTRYNTLDDGNGSMTVNGTLNVGVGSISINGSNQMVLVAGGGINIQGGYLACSDNGLIIDLGDGSNGGLSINGADVSINTAPDQAGSHNLNFFDASNNVVASINAGVDPPSMNIYSPGAIYTQVNTLDDGTGQSYWNQSMHLNGNVIDGVDSLYFTSNLTGQNEPYISSTVVLKSTTNTTSPGHSTATSVAGSTTSVFTNTQFAGTSGSTAYTVNDLVTLLKTAGILKA